MRLSAHLRALQLYVNYPTTGDRPVEKPKALASTSTYATWTSLAE